MSCTAAPTPAPSLVLHEGLGSSLLPMGTDLHARRLGLRIIAVDRPGFGLSDERPGYSLASVADDILELADALSLRRAAVSGVLGGAGEALARTGHGPADDLRAFRAGEAIAPRLTCRVVSWHGAGDVLSRLLPSSLATLGTRCPRSA